QFNCHDEAHSGCSDYLDYVLGMQGDVAALIAEPMRWTTVELPPPGYWQRVREICDKHEVLLIFDEIPSALGRTGKMFVCEHFDVVPDMLVIGKGLGGGVFPMAALIASDELDIVGDRALGHYTHEKSSVGCAAALATLDCIYDDELIENSIALGQHALERLSEMQSRLSLIHDIRGLGLHLGIELRRDGKPASDEADAVLYHSLARGLSYKVGGGCVLTLCPPMTINQDQLDHALDIVEQGIQSVS
ncbi:MAG: aminotransferase class III-fold pyridoxal phosphate-dependent enzyme, partial [Gammaproteobacteria bacterium]